jgi:hypothetical protein
VTNAIITIRDGRLTFSEQTKSLPAVWQPIQVLLNGNTTPTTPRRSPVANINNTSDLGRVGSENLTGSWACHLGADHCSEPLAAAYLDHPWFTGS